MSTFVLHYTYERCSTSGKGNNSSALDDINAIYNPRTFSTIACMQSAMWESHIHSCSSGYMLNCAETMLSRSSICFYLAWMLNVHYSISYSPSELYLAVRSLIRETQSNNQWMFPGFVAQRKQLVYKCAATSMPSNGPKSTNMSLSSYRRAGGVHAACGFSYGVFVE